jgi:hypothetical protein
MAHTAKPRLDLSALRGAIAGREVEILETLCRLPRSILDGKHHPCPWCRGKDRFRIFLDGSGGCFCNQCFNTNNGDVIATYRKVTGDGFRPAVRAVADYLGITVKVGRTSKKKNAADPAEHLEFREWCPGDEVVLTAGLFTAKPGITFEAIKACGGRTARYRGQFSVVAFPVYGETLVAAAPVGWVMLNVTGGPLPRKDGWVKVKLTYGSRPGFVGQVTRLADRDGDSPLTVWKCEGVTDMLAAISAGMPAGHIAVTNANGANENPKPWMACRIRVQIAATSYRAAIPR